MALDVGLTPNFGFEWKSAKMKIFDNEEKTKSSAADLNVWAEGYTFQKNEWMMIFLHFT